jgi:hypothetical protein
LDEYELQLVFATFLFPAAAVVAAPGIVRPTFLSTLVIPSRLAVPDLADDGGMQGKLPR